MTPVRILQVAAWSSLVACAITLVSGGCMAVSIHQTLSTVSVRFSHALEANR